MLCGKLHSKHAEVPKLVFHISRKRPASSPVPTAGAGASAANAVAAGAGAAGAGAAGVDAGAAGAAASEPNAKKAKKVVDVESHVQCTICMSVYHKPIVLIPCLHSYCSGCWSSWRKQNMGNNPAAECPECRTECQRLQRNHAMQTLVDEFLDANPELGRTAAELRELDAANTIDPRELALPAAGASGGAADDDDDDDDDEGDGDTCPECPGRGPGARSGHTCPADGQHEQCLCCSTAMPAVPAATPATRCAMCNTGPFCALYYDPAVGRCGVCSRFATVRTFPDLGEAQLCAGIGRHACKVNRHERAIVFNYARDKGVNLWQVCRDKWLAGEWTTASTPAAPLDGNTAACSTCTANAFCELLYQYREAIPAAELPAAVTARPDCYYGFNCRTQHHRPHHAQNLNHICPATRF